MESACSCDARVRFVHSHCLPSCLFEIRISAVTAAFLWQHFLIMQRSNSLCVFIRCSLCRNGVASGTFEQKWWLTLSLCPFSHAGSDPEGPHMGGASFRPSCGHHGGTPVDCNGTQQRQRDPVWVCVYLCFYIITPYLLPKPHILSELGLLVS